MVIDALVGATKSDRHSRREQALYLLHQTDLVDERAVMSTLEEALAEENVTVKSYAIHALAERGGAPAIGVLHQTWRDSDVAIKRMVIVIVG